VVSRKGQFIGSAFKTVHTSFECLIRVDNYCRTKKLILCNWNLIFINTNPKFITYPQLNSPRPAVIRLISALQRTIFFSFLSFLCFLLRRINIFILLFWNTCLYQQKQNQSKSHRFGRIGGGGWGVGKGGGRKKRKDLMQSLFQKFEL
jgi:hypothetical protein